MLPLAQRVELHSTPLSMQEILEVIDQLKVGAEDILAFNRKNGALMEQFISPKKEAWKALLERPTASYEDLEPLVEEVFEIK